MTFCYSLTLKRKKNGEKREHTKKNGAAILNRKLRLQENEDFSSLLFFLFVDWRKGRVFFFIVNWILFSSFFFLFFSFLSVSNAENSDFQGGSQEKKNHFFRKKNKTNEIRSSLYRSSRLLSIALPSFTGFLSCFLLNWTMFYKHDMVVSSFTGFYLVFFTQLDQVLQV